ncbi:hypothetical protein FEM33_13965 [Dyadobacter flavalbus]|uniref:Lipoprotein n=1 Tax=Dyadobacter flavalbus TaxID=2579942 RepID=A0A5M8QY63_9BACT|nr:hypothetical protein [Dyadobacter flavalbus]KAA6439363.1 hypothetical protein FEM33_13965 [Dyadobacter flavalbus]
MKFREKFVGLCLLTSLLACQNSNEPPASSTEKGTLKVTFDGKTRIYTDARISEGKLGSIASLSINGGSTESDYLTITAFGSEAGTYPYKQDINDYKAVSQVEYKTAGTSFNNYFAQICPDKSGYYSTKGEVKILEYVPGKHAKGTFTGALLDSNSEDECNPASKSFSGEFDLTLN